MGRQKKTITTHYKVRISLNALQHIDEITGYISFINQQPLNAIKVGDAIFAAIARIEQHPFAFEHVKKCRQNPRLPARDMSVMAHNL